MKLLYGTSNPAKLKSMREMLAGLDIEIIGLCDIDIKLIDIDESGNIPIENAKIKALAYYEALKIPVFSCDSGLYIEGLEDENQPGVHVRRVNGKVLDDIEMIEHYTGLAKNLGGEVKARYKNAICLVVNGETVHEYDGDDISSVEFIITSKPHPKIDVGFPLDSISIDIETGKYYMDFDSNTNSIYDDEITKGFRGFFQRTIL